MLAELQFGTSTSHIINRDWLTAYARQVVLLQHPTLLRIFDVCVDDQDRWVLVRQALPGRWRWLYDRGVLEDRNELETVGSILLSVAEALAYLHQAKFRGTNFSAWHESARIAESSDGELHFGMTPPTPVEAFQNPETSFMGCIGYSAPEAFEFDSAPGEFAYRPPTLASDSFSLGSLLFELLAGRKLINAPVIGEAVQLLRSCEFPALRDIRPDVPTQLNDFVCRALARAPEARPSLREWGFMMENFGGRVLTPPSTSLDIAPDAGAASQGSAPTLLSVLKDEPGNRRITMLAPMGSGGMSGEYLAEILIDEPEGEGTVSAETPSAEPADDEAPTQRLPRSVNTGALPADFAAQPDPPIYLDENVQFTVYRPKAIVPKKWYSLLAFAHLSEKREDAAEDEPDPVAEVRRQAQGILGAQAADYQNLTQDTLQAIPREGTITFVPTVPGIEFNPPSRSFIWEESVHREDFRLRAERARHDGRILKGRLSVFLGSILLADIPLSIKVDSHQASTQQKEPLEETHARPYRKIFASYSHRDIEVVEQFEHFLEALGDRYLRDVKYLRAGETWSEKLEEMILKADIFQLFWSSNSMQSPFVRQEWEYALSLQRPNFIRPTYWEDPMPAQPDQKLPPEELMCLHFQRIHSGRSSPAQRDQPTLSSAPPAATPTEAFGEARFAERERETTLSDDSEVAKALDSYWEKRTREKGRHGVGGLESIESIESPLERMVRMADQMGRSGVGSSGRRGVGGSYSGEIPLSHAAPPGRSQDYAPTFSSPPQQMSRSGAGGTQGAFGNLPVDRGNARSSLWLVAILLLTALGLLGLLSVLLYFALT